MGLLTMKRNGRVHARGAAGGKIAGGGRDRQQQHRNGGESEGRPSCLIMAPTCPRTSEWTHIQIRQR